MAKDDGRPGCIITADEFDEDGQLTAKAHERLMAALKEKAVISVDIPRPSPKQQEAIEKLLSASSQYSGRSNQSLILATGNGGLSRPKKPENHKPKL